MVLTTKHHDGFCLWPSKYTEHSVKNSPCPVDVVKEAADACRRGGIKFGLYLSPWDRNCSCYGTPEYNDYFCNQLTELLTQYGEIFYVWFDNACGEGKNGKKQDYDFPRYFELIHRYQPGAVIFNDFGPGPLAKEGSLSYLYNTENELGSMPTILYSKGLTYVPSEIDMSIRPGWFWHPDEEPHSLERLFHTYLKSCGANACLNLNLPPDRDGLLDERDIKRLRELRALIDRELGNELPATIEKESGHGPTQPVYTITLDSPRDDIKYIVLKEDISKGQRVESFRITAETDDEARSLNYPIYQGTCIGHKKICMFKDPFAKPEVSPGSGSDAKIKKLKVHITAARDEVIMKSISVF